MPPEIRGTRTVHDGWATFLVAEVTTPEGTAVTREIEDHGNSVSVLPYDPERRVATLVRELRVPPLFATGEHVQLEAPAGLIDAGSPEENGRREVLEEVGLRLRDLEFVGATYSCASLTTEKLHLYLAPYGRADRTEDGGGADGEHENIRIVEIPLADLAGRADRAELTDLKTLTLILALRARHPELFAA